MVASLGTASASGAAPAPHEDLEMKNAQQIEQQQLESFNSLVQQCEQALTQLLQHQQAATDEQLLESFTQSLPRPLLASILQSDANSSLARSALECAFRTAAQSECQSLRQCEQQQQQQQDSSMNDASTEFQFKSSPLATLFELCRVCCTIESVASASNDESIATTTTTLCDASLLFSLMHDVLEALPLSALHSTFESLHSIIHALHQTHPQLVTKNKLLLLKTCNQLLTRRLNKTSERATVLCGQVLCLLAHCLPVDERSGVNVQAKLNTDNVTELQHVNADDLPSELIAHGSVDSKSQQVRVPLSAELYRTLWSLQSYLYAAPQMLFKDSTKFDAFTAAIDTVLTVFETLPCSASSSNCSSNVSRSDASAASAIKQLSPRRAPSNSPLASPQHRIDNDDSSASSLTVSAFRYFPKYLTGVKLLPLQLVDAEFRRHLLVQLLIYHQFCINPQGDQPDEAPIVVAAAAPIAAAAAAADKAEEGEAHSSDKPVSPRPSAGKQASASPAVPIVAVPSKPIAPPFVSILTPTQISQLWKLRERMLRCLSATTTTTPAASARSVDSRFTLCVLHLLQRERHWLKWKAHGFDGGLTRASRMTRDAVDMSRRLTLPIVKGTKQVGKKRPATLIPVFKLDSLGNVIGESDANSSALHCTPMGNKELALLWDMGSNHEAQCDEARHFEPQLNDSLEWMFEQERERDAELAEKEAQVKQRNNNQSADDAQMKDDEQDTAAAEDDADDDSSDRYMHNARYRWRVLRCMSHQNVRQFAQCSGDLELIVNTKLNRQLKIKQQSLQQSTQQSVQSTPVVETKSIASELRKVSIDESQSKPSLSAVAASSAPLIDASRAQQSIAATATTTTTTDASHSPSVSGGVPSRKHALDNLPAAAADEPKAKKIKTEPIVASADSTSDSKERTPGVDPAANASASATASSLTSVLVPPASDVSPALALDSIPIKAEPSSP